MEKKGILVGYFTQAKHGIKIMLNFFRGESITIIRRTLGPDDRFGNPTYTEELITTEAIAAYQNSGTSSSNIGKETKTEIRLMFEQGTIIEENDIFSFHGTLWERDGSIETRDPNLIPNNFLPAPVVVGVKQKVGGE
jgi:hypothetical protein